MGRKISYVLLILFCSCIQVSIAQSYQKNPCRKKIDSLQHILSILPEDTSKVNTQILIVQLVIDSGEFLKADSIAVEALELSEKLNYRKGKRDTYNKIGIVFLNQNMYPEAREYFMKALAQDEPNVGSISKCLHLSNIGITYDLQRDFYTAMKYNMQALQIAESIKSKQGIAACYNNIGMVSIRQNKYKHALACYFKALNSNQNPADKGILYSTLSNIGIIYEYQGNYFKALNFNFKALKIAEAIPSKIKIEICVSNIGNVYSNLGNFPKALEYYFKALKMVEEMNNRKGTANLFSYIGTAYLNQGDKERAKEYLLKGYRIMERMGDKEGVAYYLGNMGTVYMEKKDTVKAMQYYLRALKINKELGMKGNINPWLNNIASIYESRARIHKEDDSSKVCMSNALAYYVEALKNAEEIGQKTEVIRSYLLLGSFYNSGNNLEEAEDYLRKALRLSVENGEILSRKDIHFELSKLYHKLKRYELEVENYRQCITLRDSIFNKENTKKAMRTELNFEFEKKQSLEKVEQEKKNVLSLVDRKRQRIMLWFVVGFALLILAASIFMYRSYLQKQRINNELHVRNQRIEIAHRIIKEKNNEITDSINYALHIQQAMLPDKNEIFNVLPQSFVLFKPKDIVSGDFYFFTNYHAKIYIATADCTGHGVPGGFMSMIGSEKLNNAIKQSSDPGVILSLVNEGIKRSLHQSEHAKTNRDGMDIALCAIDLKKRTVEFAGANRPIWIIRKNSLLLEEIKGTKASIGGLTEDDRKFETHFIKLQAGDTFYIGSDGYADQFGLNDNKKLTSRILKNILVAINHKPLPEQDRFLDDFIADWRGNIEQTDDILLVGIRVS